ncbi:hypothetical protein V6N13_042037 [Hibiscus sabdariffa]
MELESVGLEEYLGNQKPKRRRKLGVSGLRRRGGSHPLSPIVVNIKWSEKTMFWEPLAAVPVELTEGSTSRELHHLRLSADATSLVQHPSFPRNGASAFCSAFRLSFSLPACSVSCLVSFEMGDAKGDGTRKQTPQQAQHPPSPPKEAPEQSSETKQKHVLQPSAGVVTADGPPFISLPLYVPAFEQQFEPVNPKKTRYNSSTTATGQWKLVTTESSPSPTTNPRIQARVTAGSSSDTVSSPPQSPLPSTTSGGQETNKPEGEQFHQYRKGKYVSPVWKPDEMLWLARAWRVQYLGGGSDASGGSSLRSGVAVQATRGKTRADKDKEVAEFLNKHGIHRDAKTAGTKWDNMLGEFRKVYEWERGGEKEQVGKSYFRLSPYERKLHRLPASFDEEVFEELSQFMGPRMRTSPSRGASAIIPSDDGRGFKALPMPPPFIEELPLSVRTNTKQTTSLLGFDNSLVDVGVGYHSSSSSSKELGRIGKIRMTWEESVTLWAEEGEHHRGRVRLQGSSFLNADELTFFDDAMVASTMEAFEDGPLKGFSVDRFLNGQQVKVFGRRKLSSASASTSGTN